MLRPGGHLVYAVPTARHLYGLKEVLYDHPYENEVKDTAYEGFTFVRSVEAAAQLTLTGDAVQQLFAMTPYYWNTPADGARAPAGLQKPDHPRSASATWFTRNNNPKASPMRAGFFCAYWQ